MNHKQQGLDLYKSMLADLENKTSKKAQKQKVNLEKFLKDQGEDIGELKKEISTEKKLQDTAENHYVYYQEKDFPQNLARPIIEDELILSIKPTLILVKIHDPFNNWILPQLKEQEEIERQCLYYPKLKYKAINHGLMMHCEICLKAFTEHNKFCEVMIYNIRDYGFGLKPFVNNLKWKKQWSIKE
jgi:hypothetical protein